MILAPPSIIRSNTNYIAVIAVNTSGMFHINLAYHLLVFCLFAGVTIAGTYTVVVSSTGQFCLTQARGRSPIESFVAFTQVQDATNGSSQDDAHFAPLLDPGQLCFV
jgi:hypothetical protein